MAIRAHSQFGEAVLPRVETVDRRRQGDFARSHEARLRALKEDLTGIAGLALLARLANYPALAKGSRASRKSIAAFGAAETSQYCCR